MLYFSLIIQASDPHVVCMRILSPDVNLFGRYSYPQNESGSKLIGSKHVACIFGLHAVHMSTLVTDSYYTSLSLSMNRLMRLSISSAGSLLLLAD